jgi:hypothetical protein
VFLAWPGRMPYRIGMGTATARAGPQSVRIRYVFSCLGHAAAAGVRAGVLRDLFCLLLFFGAALFLLRDSLLTGRVFYENDTRDFYYPLMARVAQLLRQDRLPLWAPELFGGYPLFADGEAGTLYPLHFVALKLLPFEVAFVWLRILRYWLAGSFMYAYGRFTGMSRGGALGAGLVFMLCGFSIAQMHHTNISQGAIWLPVVLLCVEGALRKPFPQRYLFMVGGALALACQALAVHVQVVLMTLLATGLYALYRVIVGPVGGGVWGGRRPEHAPLTRATVRLLRRGYRVLVQNILPPGLLTQATGAASGATRFGTLIARPVRGVRHALWLALTGLAHVTWRAALFIVLLTVIVGGGLGLAAVQLLPLYELGRFSLRAHGVSYSFATQYSLPPANLATLLLPDLFVDHGRYWGAWSRWETTIYAGIVPLLLALVALLAVRNRSVLFFGLLAVLAGMLALGDQSPFGLHRRLVELPGFMYLRAPGRFAFLFDTSIAVLAGHAITWLSRRGRLRVTLPAPAASLSESGQQRAPLMRAAQLLQSGAARGWTAVCAAAAVVGVLFLAALLDALALLGPLALQRFSASLAADKEAAVEAIRRLVLSARGMDGRVTIEYAYHWLERALDASNPLVALQVGFLVAGALVLFCWLLVPRLQALWQTLALILIATDLLTSGTRFHPLISLRELSEPSPAAQFLAAQPGLFRVLTAGRTPDRPNRLLPVGLQEADGYSSLQQDRHLQYITRARFTENRLVDLLNVRFLVQPNVFTPAPSFELTSYNPIRPLMSASAGNAASTMEFRVPSARADRLRLVSALHVGAAVPQGERVAQIIVYPADGSPPLVLPILAGVHTAEQNIEREDVRPQAQHERARVAQSLRSRDAQGREYQRYLYFAELPLPRQMVISRIGVKALHPTARFQLYGLSLFDSATWQAMQFTASELEKYVEVYRDERVVIYENRAVLPRAFLVPRAVNMTAPDPDALNDVILTQMTEGDFDPERMVILENVPPDTALPSPEPAAPGRPVVANAPYYTESISPAGTVRIDRYTAQRVRMTVQAAQPAVLLLTDTYYPGWRAFIDNAEVPMYRADFIFRGVLVPPGEHVVEFAYHPASFEAGLALTRLAAYALASLAAFCVLATLLPPAARALWRWVPERRRLRPLPTPGSAPAGSAAG